MTRFKLWIWRVLRALNLSHWICCHVVGKHHTHIHRILAGFAIIVAGMGLNHYLSIIHLDLVSGFTSRVTDAVGCIPVAELVLREKDKNQQDEAN